MSSGRQFSEGVSSVGCCFFYSHVGSPEIAGPLSLEVNYKNKYCKQILPLVSSDCSAERGGFISALF
ncbi:hypothetical protein, partial [Halomonas halmophila]|uniref:hypothetical protein n=1 Tax=Halomonas halmophila TaxID=252 RepID=UPI001C3FC644